MYKSVIIITIMLLACGGNNNAATRKRAVKKKWTAISTQKPKSTRNNVAISDNTSDDGLFVHEVAQGETLLEIANTYDVTIKELISWNKLNSNEIKPGDKLKVLFSSDNSSFSNANNSKDEDEYQSDVTSSYEISEDDIIGTYSFTVTIEESNTEISGTLTLNDDNTATQQGILRQVLLTNDITYYFTYSYVANNISWRLDNDMLLEKFGYIQFDFLDVSADKEDDIVKYYKKHPDEVLETAGNWWKQQFAEGLLSKRQIVEITPHEMVTTTYGGTKIIYHRQ